MRRHRTIRLSLAARVAAGALALAAMCGATLTPTRSRHYEVYSDLRGQQFKSLVAHMDAVHDEYTRRFANFAVRNRLPFQFYLFEDRKDYERMLQTKGVNAANTAGMFFARQGPGGGEAGLAAWVGGNDRQRLLHTLQHEGFHQFAFARLGVNLPIWLNEGLAEYFGQGLLIGDRFELGLAPEDRLLRLRQALRRGTAFPFSQMLRMSHEEWNGRVAEDRGALQYDQAWAMVHFLVHGDNGKYSGALERYIALLAEGAPSEEAFEKAFSTSNPAAFEQAWRNFVADAEPDALSCAVERLEFLGEGLKALHQRRVRVDSIEDLQRELQRVRFRLTISDHAVRRTLSSADERLFQAPFERGRRARLELVPSRVPSLPAGLRISGLRATAILQWSQAPDGALESEILFR